jgi:hypothetical protein
MMRRWAGEFYELREPARCAGTLMSFSRVAIGLERTYRHQLISVANDLCEKRHRI